MRTWLPLVIVVSLISLGLWFMESPSQPLLGKRPTQQQHSKAADLIIRDARTRHYNVEGALAYQVDADRITFFQFARRDRADLTRPRMVFYQGADSRWRTESRSGVAYDNGQKVVLQGKVVVSELPQPGITLRTEKITLKPREEFAETDKVVTITDGVNRTTGKGMRADLKQDKVEILANVESRYETR